MRLKLVPDNTNFNFFGYAKITFGASVVAMILSLIAWGVMGLNFGIDFRGGAAMELTRSGGQTLDLGAVRGAVDALNIGEVGVQGIDTEIRPVARAPRAGGGQRGGR